MAHGSSHAGGKDRQRGRRPCGSAAGAGSGRGLPAPGLPAPGLPARGPRRSPGPPSRRAAGRSRAVHLMGRVRAGIRGHRGAAGQRGQRGTRAHRGQQPGRAAPAGGGPAPQPGPARPVLALVLRPVHRPPRPLPGQRAAGLGLRGPEAHQLRRADGRHRRDRGRSGGRAGRTGRAPPGWLVRPRQRGDRAGRDRAAGIRGRDRPDHPVLHGRHPPAARGIPPPAGQLRLERPPAADPAGRHPAHRDRAVHPADDAGGDDRGAGVRLRGDGPAQGRADVAHRPECTRCPTPLPR